MNRFDRLKEQILEQYPPLNKAGIFTIIKSYFGCRLCEVSIIETEGLNYFSQSAVTVLVDGKEYFKRWGRL